LGGFWVLMCVAWFPGVVSGHLGGAALQRCHKKSPASALAAALHLDEFSNAGNHLRVPRPGGAIQLSPALQRWLREHLSKCRRHDTTLEFLSQR